MDRTAYVISRAELAMGSSARLVDELRFQGRVGWLCSWQSMERLAAREVASLIWC